MLPPFRYYGGKSRYAKKIVELIPDHKIYVEPFAGAAAVFFAKPKHGERKSKGYTEFLNDTNSLLVNFFTILRDNPKELIYKIELTPYSHEVYKETGTILYNPETYDNITLAWAFFMRMFMSFSGILNSGVSFSLTDCSAYRLKSKVKTLYDIAERVRDAVITKYDAIKCIEKTDSEDTFFYIDPPYINAHQGHYGGYKEEDYQSLINAIDGIKGSYILSNYDQNIVPKYEQKYDIKTRMFVCEYRSKKRKKEEKERVEVLYRKVNGKYKNSEYRGKSYAPKNLQLYLP